MDELWYGLFVVSILEKIDKVVIGAYCIHIQSKSHASLSLIFPGSVLI